MSFTKVIFTRIQPLLLKSQTPLCFKSCSFSLIANSQQLTAVSWSHTCHQQIRYKRKVFVDFTKIKPLNFDYSEDLVKQEELCPDELLFKYRDIPEIEQMPPHLKKLFTVKFGSGKEKLEHRNMVVQDKLSDLVGPAADYERQIAYLTVKIRNLMPYVMSTRQNKKHKQYLIERIAKRKKILGYLRQLDYDRYLWMLREMKMTYTQPDPYRFFNKKKSERIMTYKKTREDLFQAISDKMEKVKAEVQAEKEKFFKEKEMVLAQIDQQIAQAGLNKEEVIARYEKKLQLKTDQLVKFKKRPKVAWKTLNDYILAEKARKQKEKRVI
ncbi:28S ribosomal protein S15, mitochondrial-like isoform X2 [Dreissena polymorpha]|uniref:28S ribosomal protein S15, mitochondrial-like isoform X2 n=1 Tax=Dreissena polymorpha TaxID=45954 RepID=UPI002264F2CC|nr:28S ribosomal protein S15, mitochondrial-like isoform X2 [Dreissena polymorpha]